MQRGDEGVRHEFRAGGRGGLHLVQPLARDRLDGRDRHPAAAVEAGATRSLAVYGGGIILSIALGLLSALAIARGIAAPMAWLSAAAQALGRREAVVPPSTPIFEIRRGRQRARRCRRGAGAARGGPRRAPAARARGAHRRRGGEPRRRTSSWRCWATSCATRSARSPTRATSSTIRGSMRSLAAGARVIIAAGRASRAAHRRSARRRARGDGQDLARAPPDRPRRRGGACARRFPVRRAGSAPIAWSAASIRSGSRRRARIEQIVANLVGNAPSSRRPAGQSA